MVKVTDKQYYMDSGRQKKLDLICKRVSGKTNNDATLLYDGETGTGKTTIATQDAYYISWKTGREFNVNHIFFSLEDLRKFAISTKKQIILWDEAALGALASDWNTMGQKKLIKLLMICRKKKHIFLFLIPKFFKLNEYICLDRSICLIHTYIKNETEMGYFVYYKKRGKEALYESYRRNHKRDYRKFYSLRGRFTKCFGELIDEEKYESEKDKAIEGIDKDPSDKETHTMNKLIKLQYAIANLSLQKDMEDLEMSKVAIALGFDRKTLYKWKKHKTKHPSTFKEEG